MEGALSLVTLGAVFLAVPVMFLTLWWIFRLGDWWNDPFGIIVFGSLASLKLWVAVFLLYVALGAAIGGVPRAWRVWINVTLAVTILLQAIAAAVALYRYQHGGRILPQEGG